MYEEYTKYPGGAVAHQYISDVLDGTIVACEFVKLACKRHLKDLKEGHKRGLWFDPESGQRVLDFKQKLKHSKGKWKGTLLILEPWQVFINWVVFGWKNDDGTRRFNKMYQEVARKNGKTTEIAATGLYGLFADNEGGAEIYSVANKEDQAKKSWEEGQSMVKQARYFGGRVECTKKATIVEKTYSCWKPLGKDSKTQDGHNTSMGLIDEYHEAPDAKMYDVIDSSMASRENPLLIVITTAGFNKYCACHDERDYAVEILRGGTEDDSYFAIIFTLDKGDDWKDESVWIKSNPNLDISVDRKKLRNACLKAINQSSKRNEIMVKRMNIWTSNVTAFLDMEAWDACNDTFKEEDLLGQECYLALDLASKSDIAALVATFRLKNKKLVILPKFYCPRERVERRERTDKVTYGAWVEKGYLTATEGNRIDYDIIKADIHKFNQLFKVLRLGFDKWNAEYFFQQLIKEGIDQDICYEYPQNMAAMSEPTKELEVLVAEGRIVHNNNPILGWNAGNAGIVMDGNENIKLMKNKSGGKIDGLIATVMDIGMEMGDQNEINNDANLFEVGI